MKEKKETTRVTGYISQSLFERAKILAVRQHITLSELIEAALTEYVKGKETRP